MKKKHIAAAEMREQKPPLRRALGEGAELDISPAVSCHCPGCWVWFFLVWVCWGLFGWLFGGGFFGGF